MKKTRILAMGMLSMTLVAMVNLSAVGAIAVVNGGFEDPVLGTEGFYALPAVTDWTFEANGGEAGMLSAAGTGSWGVPTEGQCVAIYNGAKITQTIADFVVGTATFSFYAQGYNSPLTVTLDGTPLTFGGVASVTTTGGGANGPMILYTSDSIAVGAGDHTLQFTAGGSWSFIDNVSATNVPEPSCIVLLTSSIIGLLTCARRKML